MWIKEKVSKPYRKAVLNIYKAILDANGCYILVFEWDANFSIGFYGSCLINR